MSANDLFFSQKLQFVDTKTTSIAYRKCGQGFPILFIHGWPFHSATYRHLLPYLQQYFTCYLLDLPGTGETHWQEKTDFTFPGQAKNLQEMVTHLGLQHYFVVAHNTGASIARHLALFDKARLRKLVMFNTEIPGHRPPWIPFYRNLMLIPGSTQLFRLLLRSNHFLHSPMGFAGCFEDANLIDGDFKKFIIDPLIRDPKRVEGLRLYLRGLDWGLIDEFLQTHAKIHIPILFIWGQNDPTFPEKDGRSMIEQFPNCVDFIPIPETKLLPYEEKPEEVSHHLLRFFLPSDTQ